MSVPVIDVVIELVMTINGNLIGNGNLISDFDVFTRMF